MPFVITDHNGRKQNTIAPRHIPRRVVHTLLGTPPTVAEILAIEADKTRWWLQEHDYWRTGKHRIEMQLVDEDDDDTPHVLYPIFDDPKNVKNNRQVSVFLAFDAGVYLLTEEGLIPLDASIPDLEEAGKYAIVKLRLTRGE